jgi:hypothetical protein
MKDIKTEVYCSLSFEGTHNWPNCPYEDVKFLRDPHRHIFHVKAYKEVTHADRDIEFIRLKREIQQYLYQEYFVAKENYHILGAKSCEMIALELISKFKLSKCDVSEDLENGAILTVYENKP